MKDKDWLTLIYSIRQGNCILVLGPEIAVPDDTPSIGPDGLPLPEPFANRGQATLPEMLAHRLSTEIEVTNLDPSNLAQVAEFYSMKYGRNDLEAQAAMFYHTAPRADLLADLAAIPFNLVISLAHETALVTALEEAGRSPVVEAYDFRGDQKSSLGLGRGAVGTVENPVVYYLYGHVDEPRSMVLTESDTLDFISAVISKNPELPRDLRSHLRDSHKSFLLLGFGLTRWYLRILLHVLKVSKRENRSFALESLTGEEQTFLEQTILFMRRGLKVESYNSEVAPFVAELRARFEAAGGRVAKSQRGTGSIHLNGSTAPPGEAPKIFISYASEDAQAARELYESLHRAGFEPWLDQEGLRGGDRWDAEIKNALDEVDYVVVVQSAALAAKSFSYVNKEISLALERQREARRGINFVLPVRIDDSEHLEELRHLQSVDLHHDGGFEELNRVVLRDQQRRKKRAL